MINKNELPKNWEVAKVNDIALNIQYGYTESSSVKEVGPKFLRITDIQENRVDWKNVPYCKISEESKDKYKLQDGDLVFARTGATVGKSFLIKGEIPDAVFASYLIRLRFPKTVLDKFVYNFFQSHLYWKQIVEGQVGIGQPNVNGTKLGQLLLPLPPLAEQERIVAKIEELFSELDAGSESLKTAQAQLKTYRQAVLKYAFEGKLTNDNVNEGELPKGWKWVEFGELFSESPQNGIYKPSNAYGSGTSIIRIDGFYDGKIVTDYDYKRLKLNDEEIRRYSIVLGDILVNRVNSLPYLGKCGLVKSLKEITVFESNIMKVKVRNDVAFADYVSMYLSSKVGLKELRKNAKHAVNQASINQKDVSNVRFPLCPLEEQQRIVEEIESRLSVCDKLEETIAASLKQAEALRQSILKKTFEGKLVNQVQQTSVC